MNKFITYGLLIITYLTLSKSLSPNEFGIKYINSDEALAKLIPGETISVVLTDIHSTGFIIKTYYQKYKVIYGFQSYEEIIIRTSRSFMERNIPYIGMSVLRRHRNNEEDSFTPLPPGSVFVGDKNFGTWVNTKSGKKKWRFFRVYRQIPKYLGWNDYTPTLNTFHQIQRHIIQDKPYFGENQEFGSNGTITQQAFPKYFERQKPNSINLKTFLKTYFKENFNL